LRTVSHDAHLSIATWFRHINDDSLWLAGFLLLDGGESAEEEAAGEGHHGGAAERDFVVGLEFVEFAERMVDVGGGAEFLDVTDETGSEVGLVEVLLKHSGVSGAEAGVLVGDGHAAATTAWSALLAMGQRGDGGDGRAREFGIHESSFRV
jgi:hypothetical protein